MNESHQINESKWDRRSQSYDDKRFDYFRFMQKKVISQMDLTENLNILDIGCGTGWAVMYITNLLNQNGNFYGIDISSGMVEKAKTNSERLENVHFIKANAEELPFNDSYFDKIICTNSFHHYPDPTKVMSEINRVLKSNGRIYILDVTADDIFIKWINKKVQNIEQAHVSFYSSRDYQDFFTKSGLKLIKHKRLTYPLKIHIAEK
ncbi:MAG: class I SAM-dependent methyltransferase [Bacteroidales bacterium]|jgi:ubiquinone/menaquinone biosynthesis C-methylase UbiE